MKKIHLWVRISNPFKTIFRGTAVMFKNPAYRGITVVSAVALLAVYVITPILLIPGNSLEFTLSLMTPFNYLLLAAFAVLSGTLVSLEIFSFRRSRMNTLQTAGKSGVGFISSLAGGILAAASCGCGVGFLLGAIGLGGGALFVAANQTSIIVVTLGVVIIGLYFSARRALGICGL